MILSFYCIWGNRARKRAAFFFFPGSRKNAVAREYTRINANKYGLRFFTHRTVMEFPAPADEYICF